VRAMPRFFDTSPATWWWVVLLAAIVVVGVLWWAQVGTRRRVGPGEKEGENRS